MLPSYEVYRNVTLIHEPPREVTVFPSHSEGGRISLDENLTIISKTPVTIVAIPDEGYILYHWKVNGVPTESNATELYLEPVEDVHIYAVFLDIPEIIDPNNATDPVDDLEPVDDPVQSAGRNYVLMFGGVLTVGLSIIGLFYRERIQAAVESGEVEAQLTLIRERTVDAYNRVREGIEEKVSELRSKDEDDENKDDPEQE